MKEQVLRFIGAVFLTILALLGIGAALHILVTLPFEGKGPEWVGAIGTVATLIGTIVLANTQNREKTKSDLTLARLHAASMVLRLVHAQAVVAEVCRMLDLARQIEMGPEHLTQMMDKLSGIDLWSVGELVPLVPLPNNIAVKLAQSADQIRTAQKVLKKGWIEYATSTFEEHINLAHGMHGPMSGTFRFISEAVTECNEAASALHLAGS
jgi:hypothetical protein